MEYLACYLFSQRSQHVLLIFYLFNCLDLTFWIINRNVSSKHLSSTTHRLALQGIDQLCHKRLSGSALHSLCLLWFCISAISLVLRPRHNILQHCLHPTDLYCINLNTNYNFSTCVPHMYFMLSCTLQTFQEFLYVILLELCYYFTCTQFLTTNQI